MVELIDQHKGRFETMSNGDYAPQMAEKLDLYENYATFLNTPLNISQFIPAIKVGDKWEVLEMPEDYDTWINFKRDNIYLSLNTWNDCEQYQTAKDNVIFEGFEWENTSFKYEVFFRHGITSLEITTKCIKQIHVESIKTIQDLIKYKPTLTKKGLEVSGLNNK